jgi:hypothetical protein
MGDHIPTGAAPLCGRPGVLHDAYSYYIQDEYGQLIPAQSIAPDLDYPGVGPEHAALETAAACATRRSPTLRRSWRFRTFRDSKGSSPPSSRATRSPS